MIQIFIITALLAALKLVGVIKWSWIWILFPFWGSITIVVIAFIVIAILISILDIKD